jgi:hypothetical protein
MNNSNTTTVPLWLKLVLTTLTLMVMLSIGLNLYLIQQLVSIRGQVTETITHLEPQLITAFEAADAELADFQQANITLEVDVDHDLPIVTEIPFDETIEVPVQVTVPFQEEIETTVVIDLFGAAVPVPIVVPVDHNFEIDEVIPITVKKPLAISTTIPLSLTVPLSINMSDTSLLPYVQELRDGLDTVKTTVNDTLSEIKPE